jgi:PIN domain-containing protein
LKIAFDEHVPQALAKAFKALQGEEGMLHVNIVSARDYAVPKAKSDVPWLQRFAKAKGQVIISGDAKMRGRLHERKALVDAGFIVFFLARRWNQADSYTKSAMLMRWWPIILRKAESAHAGQCFELPFSWKTIEMREVTPPGAGRRKPGPKKNANMRQAQIDSKEATTTIEQE